MTATSFRRTKWSAFSLPAFFVLALYAREPLSAEGMGLRCLRLRRRRRTRSAMNIKVSGSRIPTAVSRMRRVRRRAPG